MLSNHSFIPTHLSGYTLRCAITMIYNLSDTFSTPTMVPTSAPTSTPRSHSPSPVVSIVLSVIFVYVFLVVCVVFRCPVFGPVRDHRVVDLEELRISDFELQINDDREDHVNDNDVGDQLPEYEEIGNSPPRYEEVVSAVGVTQEDREALENYRNW